MYWCDSTTICSSYIQCCTGGYMGCNFETDLCEWDLRSLSSLKWTWTSQMNISMSEPLKGPGRDHSTNFASGTLRQLSLDLQFKVIIYLRLFSGYMILIYAYIWFLFTGHFLYVTKPAELKNDWGSFQSPPLEPTNSSHPCRVGFFFIIIIILFA